MRMAMGMEVLQNQGRKSGKHQKASPEGWPALGRLLPLALIASGSGDPMTTYAYSAHHKGAVNSLAVGRLLRY